MKHLAVYLFAAFGIFAITAYAIPPIQHSVSGVVRSVDTGKHVLTLEAAEKDGPTEFQIQDGRTRLRRDGKPATLADLAVGQTVHLYYSQEVGRSVATEVTWKSGAPASNSIVKT